MVISEETGEIAHNYLGSMFDNIQTSNKVMYYIPPQDYQQQKHSIIK